MDIFRRAIEVFNLVVIGSKSFLIASDDSQLMCLIDLGVFDEICVISKSVITVRSALAHAKVTGMVAAIGGWCDDCNKWCRIHAIWSDKLYFRHRGINRFEKCVKSNEHKRRRR